MTDRTVWRHANPTARRQHRCCYRLACRARKSAPECRADLDARCGLYAMPASSRSRLPSKSNRRALRPLRDKHFRCQPLCQTVMSMLSAPRRDRGVPARAAVRQPSRLFSHDDSRRGAVGRSDGGRGRGTHWAGESRSHDVRVRHIPRFRDDRNCRYRVRLPERPDVTSRRTRDVVARSLGVDRTATRGPTGGTSAPRSPRARRGPSWRRD